MGFFSYSKEFIKYKIKTILKIPKKVQIKLIADLFKVGKLGIKLYMFKHTNRRDLVHTCLFWNYT